MSDLPRRVVAESIGTAALVAAVVGSGVAATRLSPGQPGLQLLVTSLVTGAALLALITVLQPVSAAFNPVVTLVALAHREITGRDAGALVVAQVSGGVAGAVVANLMYDLDAVSVAATTRASPAHLLAEVVATAGLVVLVRGCAPDRVAVVVASYVTAAYWFTSSTSFANPAVTLARTFSDTFAGIAPSSVPAFLLAQLVGATLAAVTAAWLFERTPARA
ncbi:aquaporin [Nocardioides sp.]|uniref:aquaporin n=1 Tax=Nocardioides sp. TaxID=35761 RepID=UPI002720C2CF|nr:aquaporin [Nocardioides sp.]MDO9456690.1 aquaporin [Nocardioides sp.]